MGVVIGSTDERVDCTLSGSRRGIVIEIAIAPDDGAQEAKGLLPGDETSRIATASAIMLGCDTASRASNSINRMETKRVASSSGNISM